MTTAQEIGTKIGKAIARDVLAEDMPRKWTGLDAQDVDQIPEGMDHAEVERFAEAAYGAAIGAATAKINVGDKVTAGEGEDRDTGIVAAIDGGMATVQWDSLVVTPCPLSDLVVIRRAK